MMRYLMRGFRLVLTKRELWPYIYKPLLWSFLILILLLTVGFLLLVPLIQSSAQSLNINQTGATAASIAIYIGLAVLLSGPAFLATSGILSSLLWEDLSRKVEQMHSVEIPNSRIGLPSLFVDTMLRFGFSCFILIASIICGFTLLQMLVPLLTGWLALYDYTSCAFLRRNVLFPDQFKKATRLNGSVSFSIVCGIISIFPFINILMIPAMISGGTLMVADYEK